MSCADVCLSHDYDELPGFSRSVTRRARKAHKCCECGGVIPVGAEHEVCTGRWDGMFDTYRTCAACAEIRAAFVCGPWCLEMLWESMRQEMFPLWRTKGAWDCLAKLTSDAAVAKCNAEYREWCTDNEYDPGDASVGKS